ncbi:MAG TPA: hypothetical protein VFZ65_18440, partial [Planctomycetota bacterium]|nr:hypothetical protein [Planctomycetota bacterium]
LRCVRAGSPLPEAEIAIEGWREHTTAANGELRFVLTQESVRVRATHEHLRSEWRTLGPEHAGQRVVLELVESLGEVSLEFEGEFRVRNTLVRWHRADGREGAEQLLRGERSGPFRIFLEAGHYRLQIGPAPGDRNGRFLLPIERDVEVGGAPVRLVVPASFGGRFTVHATDGSGLYVGGTCRVYDAAGTDCSDRFSFELDEARGRRTSGVGELVEGGPNEFRPVLPAGEYLLQFDFGTHGLQQRRVTIQSREWLDVHVRLPD